jgi:hypothetical protein
MSFVQLTINAGDLFNPTPAVRMLQIHDGLGRPVKVIGNEGYLLVQRFEGIA